MSVIRKSGFGRKGVFTFSTFEIFGITIVVSNRFPFIGVPKTFNMPF